MMAFTNTTFYFVLFVIAQLFHLAAPSVINSAKEASFASRDSGDHNVSHDLFRSLEELAHLVDITYCVGNLGVSKPFECLSHCDEFEGFELVTTWNTGPLLSDSCGYIAISNPPFPKRIIVAFRGTYSIANTIIDLSAYQQEYVPYIGGAGGGRTSRCLNCTVHAGFLASWNNTRSIVLSHVTAAREQYPDYDVVLVGHSLGGAVAALAGLEMQIHGWNPQVTTFGEPRIGNEGFVKFLDKRFGLSSTSPDVSGDELKFRRVTHAEDPIPLLPLEEWGYKMHAGEIFISRRSLSPSITDLRVCTGDEDPECISQSGYLLETIRQLSIVEIALEDSCPPKQVKHSPSDQTIMPDEEQHYSANGCRNEALQQPPPSSSSLQWNPVPPRYRLWELLFAHRDYFLRLGVCFPGGDPSG